MKYDDVHTDATEVLAHNAGAAFGEALSALPFKVVFRTRHCLFRLDNASISIPGCIVFWCTAMLSGLATYLVWLCK